MPKTIRCDLFFSIGRYGWTEGYYQQISDGGLLSDLDDQVTTLAKKRLALCGYNVQIDEARISDVNVRRDADVLPVRLFCDSNAPDDPEAHPTPKGYKAIFVAHNVVAGNPNVSMVVRAEAGQGRYHTQHYLAAIPRDMQAGGDRISIPDDWNRGFNRYRDYLKGSSWLMPVLSQEGSFADKPVKNYDGPTALVSCTAHGFTNGDNVQIIGLKYTGVRPRPPARSIVALADADSFVMPEIVARGFVRGGKMFVHKLGMAFLPFTGLIASITSHRDRGRPSSSPVGRRKRR